MVEYYDDLLQIATKSLAKTSNPRVGPEDIVHSMYASFLAKRKDGSSLLINVNSCWLDLLAGVIRHCNKWNTRVRRHPNISLTPPGSNKGLLEPADPSMPTPQEAAMLCEMIENVNRRIPKSYAPIFEAMLAGDSVAETSTKTGLSQREIKRRRRTIRDAVVQVTTIGSETLVPK